MADPSNTKPQIFITWSGDRSHKVGDLLYEWLPDLCPDFEPWISSEDVRSGADWFNVIKRELGKSALGIVVLTPDNQQAPWLNFEAGAIGAAFEGKSCCTFLCGLSPDDVRNPLGGFNATVADNENQVRKLVRDINELSSFADKTDRTNRRFDDRWPTFKSAYEAIANTADTSAATQESPNSDDMIKEVLAILRQKKRDDANERAGRKRGERRRISTGTFSKELRNLGPWRVARDGTLTQCEPTDEHPAVAGVMPPSHVLPVPGSLSIGDRMAIERANTILRDLPKGKQESANEDDDAPPNSD